MEDLQAQTAPEISGRDVLVLGLRPGAIPRRFKHSRLKDLVHRTADSSRKRLANKVQKIRSPHPHNTRGQHGCVAVTLAVERAFFVPHNHAKRHQDPLYMAVRRRARYSTCGLVRFKGTKKGQGKNPCPKAVQKVADQAISFRRANPNNVSAPPSRATVMPPSGTSATVAVTASISTLPVLSITEI